MAAIAPTRFAFGLDDVEAVTRCTAEHGFAVVRDAIAPALAEALCADVRRALDPDGATRPGDARIDLAFVERSPALLALLADARYLRLQRALVGADDLVVHRSAAILRQPGSPAIGWHTDMPRLGLAPRTANEALNCGEWPNGMWFYLTGSRPDDGGLAVIAGSHRRDWTPPAGWDLSEDRGCIRRAGETAMYGGMDIPGTVQLETAPTDLIVFAARTYHAANPHRGAEPRLSAGLALRPRHPWLTAPWPLPDPARRLIAETPEPLRRFVHGYLGIEPAWTPEG